MLHDFWTGPDPEVIFGKSNLGKSGLLVLPRKAEEKKRERDGASVCVCVFSLCACATLWEDERRRRGDWKNAVVTSVLMIAQEV